TFNKYSKIYSLRGLTGAEAARRVLEDNRIYDVTIEPVAGNLTDHFDPRTQTIRLSEGVYSSSSVAAIGVAAHEAGHAVQHDCDYFPMRIRSVIIPATRIGSYLSWPLIIIGILLNFELLATLGIALFGAVVLFQLVTLPVEYNASSRALDALESTGVLYREEIPGAKKVLSAAAMTYLASLLMAVMQMLRLILLFGGGRRSD
ncbi:MAG: zinc metallopeptidase, partial [Clostridiales bacterium]|nr:zinc metallopeptidase [Clostridiales bacterium]